MATWSIKNHVGIDVKVPLSKTGGHTTSTFQGCRLESKLLQKLGEDYFRYCLIENRTIY